MGMRRRPVRYRARPLIRPRIKCGAGPPGTRPGRAKHARRSDDPRGMPREQTILTPAMQGEGKGSEVGLYRYTPGPLQISSPRR